VFVLKARHLPPRAPALRAGGRRFESCCPDHYLADLTTEVTTPLHATADSPQQAPPLGRHVAADHPNTFSASLADALAGESWAPRKVSEQRFTPPGGSIPGSRAVLRPAYSLQTRAYKHRSLNGCSDDGRPEALAVGSSQGELPSCRPPPHRCLPAKTWRPSAAAPAIRQQRQGRATRKRAARPCVLLLG
jgi:hypothetical protein